MVLCHTSKRSKITIVCYTIFRFVAMSFPLPTAYLLKKEIHNLKISRCTPWMVHWHPLRSSTSPYHCWNPAPANIQQMGNNYTLTDSSYKCAVLRWCSSNHLDVMRKFCSLLSDFLLSKAALELQTRWPIYTNGWVSMSQKIEALNITFEHRPSECERGITGLAWIRSHCLRNNEFKMTLFKMF